MDDCTSAISQNWEKKKNKKQNSGLQASRPAIRPNLKNYTRIRPTESQDEIDLAPGGVLQPFF